MEIQPTTNVSTVPETKFTPFTKNKQLLASCMIGNALEWYDFVIYGYFTVTFGALFFSKADSVAQLIASWGVFWTGFLARPLGSLVFGYIGDKVSRKSALTWSVYLMAIPTALMGCLPSYDQVGLIAPIALIFLRTLQGFAMGGEFTGTMIFLVEHAPQSRRGFWGSFASFSAVMGIVIGSLLVASLNGLLTEEIMHIWGWRIPFILSIFGSSIAGYMRNRLVDPEIYLEVKERFGLESTPLKELFNKYKSNIFLIIFLDFLTAIGFFIVAIFLVTYFRTHLNVPSNIALLINTFNMCIFAAAILLGGLLSDHFGRKPLLAIPCIGFIIFSYPLFLMLETDSYYILASTQAIFALMMGLFFGTIPVTLAEIMPTRVRCSGLSIGHNISMAIFGGGAPLLATHLINYTGNLAAPSFLLIAGGLLSLSSLKFIKDRYQAPLIE